MAAMWLLRRAAAAGQSLAVPLRASASRGFQTGTTGTLARLERAAAFNERNAARQAEYLAELNKTDPQAVIRRFESGRYASNEACAREYLLALSKTERLPELYPTLMAAASPQGAGAAATLDPLTAAARAAGSGTARDPVHVIMHEPGVKSQLLRTVRGVAIFFFVLTGLSVLLEDRGMPRGMSVTQEFEQPATGPRQRFEDVQGCDEAKAELEEIVMFLKDPTKFTRLGGKLPKGVLLMGPPGTGKTMLARAIAGEANVPFLYASGSEFDEMYVGVGARRVRELFAAAKRRAPCIIFIDEIDAVGSARNPHNHQHVKMTLNQLLVEMDGFAANEGIIVIAATNYAESLDKALVRPGRFDRHVVVPAPDIRGRRQILDVHTKSMPLAADVDLDVVARGTPGFTGAELANLVNQASVKASLEGVTAVAMRHLEYAKDKIIMGAERKSAVIEESNRRIVAFHEGGHALVAMLTPGALPVHKATIMPRGEALGMVAQLPERDELSWTRKQLAARLDVAMAGRVAEELIFGAENITSGAASDLTAASRIAHAMVTRYGMSEKVGPVSISDDDLPNLSSATRSVIEEEVRLLLEQARERATKLLRDNMDSLHRLANTLLEYETLTRDEIDLVLKNKPVPRPVPARASPKQPQPQQEASQKAGVVTPNANPAPTAVVV